MNMRTLPLCLLSIAIGFSILSTKALAGTPGPPSFGSNYQLVFGQDFTSMSSLAVNATNMGSGTWVAHTPLNQDWFTFENPTSAYHPFNVGNGYLTIRVQQDGNDPNNWFGGFSGGLLSSLDEKGNGFSQQYGYFECSMWTPGTPNSWPAFWLMSAPGVSNNNLPIAEIDVSESFGNWGTGPNQNPPGNPNLNQETWHQWNSYNSGGSQIASGTSYNPYPGMTSGFHTYGVDVEPSGITWYIDRQQVWSAPIFAEAKEPLYIMIDLALGAGNYNNSSGTGYNWALTPALTDLKIQYVAVWASPSSPNYGGPTPTPVPPTPTSKPATPTPTATTTSAPVRITSPAAGSTVSGQVPFTCANPGGSANLYIDDIFVGYNSYSWNTTTFAKGSHYLLCNGYRNGSFVGSAAQNVTVGSPPTPVAPSPTPVPPAPTPTSTRTPAPMSITSPAAGSTVSGQVTFTCANPGGSANLYIDDVFVGYSSYSWNTTASFNGSHYLLCNGYRNGVGIGSADLNVSVSN
jgi:beta-glucanase (GH16 family)